MRVSSGKIILCLILLSERTSYARYDVNIVGLLGIESTACLIPTTLVDVLKDNVTVNLIPSRKLPGGAVQTSFEEDLPFKPDEIAINEPDRAPISLLGDVIGYKNSPYYKMVPDSKIKLAYSMFEADRLPSFWVSALNSTFDAVVVPDDFLVKVYQKSGVTIPIFVIPLPIYIESMLEREPKKAKNNPFVFGVSAGFSERKNYNLLITAFAKEFSNNKNFKLKIHGSWGYRDSRDHDKPSAYFTSVKEKIASLGVNNIEISTKKLSRQGYIDFIASLDCYVFLSMGEGYSITPSDALALGIPVILSAHSVHLNRCGLGSVLPIKPMYLQSAYFEQMNEFCGNFYQCNIDQVTQALKTMYNRYPYFLAKTDEGREWVKKFTKASLADKFTTLIKPDNVVLGHENSLSNRTLTTTSESLYNKYKEVLAQAT